MILRYYCNYLKTIIEVSIILLKKIKSEASFFFTLDKCKIDGNKLFISNICNRNDDFQTQSQNIYRNTSDIDLDKSKDIDNNNLEKNILK